jgi:hypothetical protein
MQLRNRLTQDYCISKSNTIILKFGSGSVCASQSIKSKCDLEGLYDALPVYSSGDAVNIFESTSVDVNIFTDTFESKSLSSELDGSVPSEGPSCGTNFNSFVFIGKHICEALEATKPVEDSNLHTRTDTSGQSGKFTADEKSFSWCSSSDSTDSNSLVVLPQKNVDKCKKEQTTDGVLATFSVQSKSDEFESLIGAVEDSMYSENLPGCEDSVEQKSDVFRTQESIKIVLLLVAKKTPYELLHLEFDVHDTLVRDVLDKVSTTVKGLKPFENYHSLCNISGEEFPSDVHLKSIITKENEVKICVPEGITAAESAKLAAPLVQAMNALKFTFL